MKKTISKTTKKKTVRKVNRKTNNKKVFTFFKGDPYWDTLIAKIAAFKRIKLEDDLIKTILLDKLNYPKKIIETGLKTYYSNEELDNEIVGFYCETNNFKKIKIF